MIRLEHICEQQTELEDNDEFVATITFNGESWIYGESDLIFYCPFCGCDLDDELIKRSKKKFLERAE